MDFLKLDVGMVVMDYLHVGEFVRLLAAMKASGLLDNMRARTIKRRKLKEQSSSFMDYVMDRLKNEFVECKRPIYSSNLPQQSLLNLCIASHEKLCMKCTMLIDKRVNEPYCKEHYFDTFYPHDLIDIAEAQRLLGRTSFPTEVRSYRQWESVSLYPVPRSRLTEYIRDSNSLAWKYEGETYIRRAVFDAMVRHFAYMFVEGRFYVNL